MSARALPQTPLRELTAPPEPLLVSRGPLRGRRGMEERGGKN